MQDQRTVEEKWQDDCDDTIIAYLEDKGLLPEGYLGTDISELKYNSIWVAFVCMPNRKLYVGHYFLTESDPPKVNPSWIFLGKYGPNEDEKEKFFLYGQKTN